MRIGVTAVIRLPSGDAISRTKRRLGSAGNRTVLDIAREALAIARRGLENRSKRNANGDDETHFLAPLEETLALEQTQAQRMLALYRSSWERDVRHIFDEYAY